MITTGTLRAAFVAVSPNGDAKQRHRDAQHFALAYGLYLTPCRDEVYLTYATSAERRRAIARLMELGFTQATDCVDV